MIRVLALLCLASPAIPERSMAPDGETSEVLIIPLTELEMM